MAYEGLDFTLPKAGIDSISGSGETLEGNLRTAPTSIDLPTGGYSISDADKTMTAKAALDLIQGLTMGGYDSTAPDVQGLNMFAPPPQFNEAQAQSSIQQAQQFGTQKGSKIGSGIGTGLGLLLAPLTGGLSIGLGGSIGGAIGGAIGGGISEKAEQNVVDAQRRAQNRIGMAYQDVTQERNTYDAQSAQRRQNMEMMRQAAFGDLANLYG